MENMEKITIYTDGHNFVIQYKDGIDLIRTENYEGWGSELTLGISDEGVPCYMGAINA